MFCLCSVALECVTYHKSLYIIRITAYLNAQALLVSRLFSEDSIDVS